MSRVFRELCKFTKTNQADPPCVFGREGVQWGICTLSQTFKALALIEFYNFIYKIFDITGAFRQNIVDLQPQCKFLARPLVFWLLFVFGTIQKNCLKKLWVERVTEVT